LKKLSDAFKANWQLILLSFFLALLLWVYVVSAEAPQMERVFTIAIKARNVPNDLALTQGPGNVTVRVRGPVRMEIRSEDLEAFVDLQGKTDGQWLVPVQMKSIPGANLVEMNPEKVLVTLESITTKTMPVEIMFLGKLPQGFTLGPVEEIKPEQVELKGPGSFLEKAQRVIAPVTLTGITAQISQTVPLRVVDDKGQEVSGVELNPQNVDVTIAINAQTLSKTVPIIPLLDGSLPEGLVVRSVFCEPQVATLEGSADVLEGISALYTYPISLSYKTESFQERTYIDSSSTSARIISEPLVTVKVEIEEEGRAAFEVSIQVKRDGASVTLKTEQVSVFVSGPKSLVETLRERDFSAWVDASGLSPGTYNLPVKVESPPGVVILKVDPSGVEVEVSP
jgi:YbbR domain-containing protein